MAAGLYGIGARLDDQPQLLFTLRKVDQQDLIAMAAAGLSTKRKRPAGARVLAGDDLSAMFGIEMAPATPAKPKKPAPTRRDGKQRLTPAKRRAISERMRKRWAAKRVLLKKPKVAKP